MLGGTQQSEGLYKNKQTTTLIYSCQFIFLIKATISDWLSFLKTSVWEGLKMTILGISTLGDIIIPTVEKKLCEA